jgi:antitoxin (DNA-binding transcriptional repressor) of toxin-antitoxin stability system
MRSVSISVTETARNFADCMNRVRYQGMSFILHKNGVAVARIIPAGRAAEEPESPEKTATPVPAAGEHELEQARRRFIPEIW